jgi:hypothetical protein
MKAIGIVGKFATHHALTAADEDHHPSPVMQVAHVMTAVATVITALAAFVTCAAALNITTVSVLAVAWVAAGWLARGRRCHCGGHHRHPRRHEPVGGAV